MQRNYARSHRSANLLNSVIANSEPSVHDFASHQFCFKSIDEGDFSTVSLYLQSSNHEEDAVKKNALLSGAAGLVLFVWGFVSWVVLPWHMMVVNKFTNEAAISQALKENSPQRGVYYLPYSEKDHGPNQVGAFVNVLPEGTEMNMGKQMATGVVIQIVSAFLVLMLLSQTSGLTFWGKVGFFALVGLIIGFVSHAPYWNWFGFPTPYIVVTILDILIGWTLAGLAVAKFAQVKT